MRRMLVLGVAACAAVVAAAGPVDAQPNARVAFDSRCDALEGLMPATVAVVTGDVSEARAQARALRDLAGRELVPRRVKPALRKLARFFSRAKGQSIVERATALSRLSASLATILEWSADVCSGSVTPSTTRPLR